MSTVAFIRRCMAAGMDWETALIAAEAFEEVVVPAKSKGAERTAKWRAKKAESVTRDVTVTECDVGDGKTSPVTPTSRARVVNTTSPSEKVITPLSSPSESPPKKTKSARKTPVGWSPSPETLARLREEGFCPGDLERALTRMRDHEFRSPRSDWDGTFRNWVRRDADFKPPPSHAPRPDDRRETRNRIWSEIAAEEGGPRVGVPALPGRG